MTLRFLLFAALVAAPASAQTVEPWSPPGISSPAFESHPAFDPLTRDLYFVRSKPDFSGWRIMVSHCGPSGWSEAEDAPFAGDGVEADPVFWGGGRHLYFISTRSTDGVVRKDLDIWQVDRGRGGRWGKPVRLPAPINSDAQEWYPRPAPDGWLYFGSARPGGLGKTDIWRARRKGSRWIVENAGPALNTPGDEYEALPSPDGRRLILNAADGFYESVQTAKGWGPRHRLGPAINVNGSEVGALFSPGGRSLLFARDTKGPLSGELFVWRREGLEAWPFDRCPGKR